jgi:hypothetical protein
MSAGTMDQARLHLAWADTPSAHRAMPHGLAYTGIGILYPFRYTGIIPVYSETANFGVY